MEKNGSAVIEDQKIISLLCQNVVPAAGCTEPAAVALACAKAANELNGDIKRIILTVDVNLMKNALGVGIPGLGEVGLNLAAALGALERNPDKELMVLSDVKPENLQKARRFVSENRVDLKVLENHRGLFIEARVETDSEYSIAGIQGSHTSFNLLEVNNKVIFKHDTETKDKSSFSDYLSELDLPDLVEIAERLPFDKIEFLLEGLEMTEKAAEAGLSKRAGLAYGINLKELFSDLDIQPDIINATKIKAAGAADARMAGLQIPVMTSFGSGNQGIVIYTSLGAIASKENCSSEKTARAIALSQLLVGVIRRYAGLLAPHCGCAVAAGSAATVGAVYLMDGNLDAMDRGFRLILADIFGMICDGAKESCAQKVSTAAATVIECAYLAVKTDVKPKIAGIIGKNFLETLKNIKLITEHGMKDLDRSILDVMLKSCS